MCNPSNFVFCFDIQSKVGTMKVYSWGATDVGMKRDHNEDSYLLAPDLNLFVVADGMGGHAGGEMASGIAVSTVEEVVRDGSPKFPAEKDDAKDIAKSAPAIVLSRSVRNACNAVFQKSQELHELAGMGTTTTTMLFHNDRGYVAHVGDSRCYLVRQKKLVQLSEDHSLVNEQLKAGIITEEQARQSRFKNIITRSVGFQTDVEVDMIVVDAAPHDVFLMCSDGLTGLVTDEEINNIVSTNFLYRVPGMLIDLANSRGGDDNITVVCCYVAGAEDNQFAEA